MNELTNRTEEAGTVAVVGEPLLVSVPEAARLLGIGLTFTWELVHRGQRPTIRLGRRVLVSRQLLEQWIATDRWQAITD